MKITLNLATRPYADVGPALKRLRIGMLALVAAMLLIGWGLYHFHESAVRMRAEEARVDAQIAQIRREQQGYEAQMQQPANARVLTQAGFLNVLFDEKSFSWTAAMEDLERVLPAGVQATALEPVRAKDGRLTLRLRVSGQRERAVETVRNMERSKRFASPRIAGENSENNSQGDLQPVKEAGRVSFDILAEYNPATLDERKAEIAQQKHPRAVAGRHLPPAPQAGRPQYLAPNPMPMPNAQPGQLPGQVPALPPGAAPDAGPRSHDFNRNRPPDSNVPNPNGGPQ